MKRTLGKPNTKGRTCAARQGSALVITLIAVSVLASMAAIVLQISASSKKEVETARQATKAFYLAETAVSESIAAMITVDNQGGVTYPNYFNSEAAPGLLNGGSYWADIADNGDESYTITATGEANRVRKSIEAVIQRAAMPLFTNALFAGNSSEDPNYTLSFSGQGGQGDEVIGDVYSGGDLLVTDDASIDGTGRASGSVSGVSPAEENVHQATPDLAAMDYASNHDYDVAQMFADSSSYQRDSFGGQAWQLPEDNPAHIFRLNPNDRSSDLNNTEKNDYFLEDPYESVRSDSSSDGSNASLISLSGENGNPGPSGNGKVYYIDGNLWVHNRMVYSFMLESAAGSGSQITFAVSGNIYFSDNVFYGDPAMDGILFIALNDDNVQDSGNIYFGDPAFGTLEQMHAFMYAENDFVDYNLDESGSSRVLVNGTMSAGNHVNIQRDYWDDGQVEHSKLTVDLDDRVANGQLTLPGMPTGGNVVGGYTIVSWRELSQP